MLLPSSCSRLRGMCMLCICVRRGVNEQMRIYCFQAKKFTCPLFRHIKLYSHGERNLHYSKPLFETKFLCYATIMKHFSQWRLGSHDITQLVKKKYIMNFTEPCFEYLCLGRQLEILYNNTNWHKTCILLHGGMEV